MNKSILVLDENSVIHGLITSALETEGLTLHHEFNPGKFVERANSLMPDLILIGNSERDPEYEICRTLKGTEALSDVPLVLLASSKESLSRDQLSHLGVRGVVRKPFEASDLQQQVSKHLDLVDLIGSAYEYRQTQSIAEEGQNPLANLDVLDDEVLGMLRGAGGADAAGAEEPTVPQSPPTISRDATATPVVDDEVLAEALQPERAFEAVDGGAVGGASTEPESAGTLESLESLDGEFPSEALEVPSSEAQLDELGAADMLEEEAPEESVLEPQGFDQELDGTATPTEAEADLDDIEVELPDDGVDTRSMEQELDEGAVDLFEADLAADEPAGSGEGVEESIPLSVRRMMELKPVFTMTQEESAQPEDSLEAFSFEPDSDEVDAIQSELESIEEVPLDDMPLEDVSLNEVALTDELDEEAEPAREQELTFASEDELRELDSKPAATADLEIEDLEPPEDFSLLDDSAPEGEELELEAEEMQAAEIDPDIAESLEAEPAPAAEPTPPESEAPPQDEPARTDRTDRTDRTVQAVVDAPDSEDDEDFFVEEYLGDEEIDEDQIIAAEEEEGDEEEPPLSAEDEAELDELLAEEEHLAGEEDLDALDDVLDADDAKFDADEEIELEDEEEAQILTSLETERDETARIADTSHEEPLFERNFNNLEEEGAAAPDSEESWPLSAADGGFAIADEADEATSEASADGDVIDLDSPMEEVPSSALEEVESDEMTDAMADDLAMTGLDEAASAERTAAPVVTLGGEDEGEADLEPVSFADEADAEDDAPVSIEFGEDAPDVFAEETLDTKAWKPDAPPGFVASATEDFPEDAVEEPFVGPEGTPEEPGPPPTPRHAPEEVLEDPESGAPVLPEDEELEPVDLSGDGEGDSAVDLADGVQPHELEDDEEPEDEFVAEPSLSVLADDALGGVDESMLGSELGDSAEDGGDQPGAMDDAFEPVQLGADGGSDTPDEVDALLSDEPGSELEHPDELEGLDDLVAEDAVADEPEDLESLLGSGHADAEDEDTEDRVDAVEPPATASGDPEFDNLFASLQEEIAANPEGERLDDVLHNERIRDLVAELEFSLPQHENTFARAMGIYALPGDDAAPSAYPAALGGAPAPVAPAAPAAPSAPVVPEAPPAQPSAAATAAPIELPAESPGMPDSIPTAASIGVAAADVSALSLLDPDIRAKLGQVLDEIISISVRKAVQEEMPKLMERMSKDT